MAHLAIQQAPAGIPVNDATKTELVNAGFSQDGGVFRSQNQDWEVIAEFSNERPTIQALFLESGVVYWYSAYHQTEAKFEYKSTGYRTVPSRINYAAKL